MSICLRRRDFIAALSGAAAWPLAARAQQGDRVGRIGVLMPYDENDPEVKRRLAAFTQALADLGWTDGRNVRMDVRIAGGDIDRTRDLGDRNYAGKSLEFVVGADAGGGYDIYARGRPASPESHPG